MGPKAFHFNNCWLSHPGFKEVVEGCWSGVRVQGWKAYVIKEKLKLMKYALRRWNLEVLGNIDSKLKIKDAREFV